MYNHLYSALVPHIVWIIAVMHSLETGAGFVHHVHSPHLYQIDTQLLSLHALSSVEIMEWIARSINHLLASSRVLVL